MRRTEIVWAGLLLPLAAILAGCATGGAAPSADAFAPAQGEVVVNVSGHYGNPENPDDCDGLANVSLTGNKVTILDAEGDIAALATLVDAGDRDLKWTERTPFQILSGSCVWTFDIPSSDTDSEFFTVTVEGVSGSLDFTRAEVEGGLTLTAPAGRP